MDWSKTKNYLIITFLLLDLLLGYQYWYAKSEASQYVQSYADQLKEVRELLASHGIELKTEVPLSTPELSFLKVRFSTKEPEAIAHDLLKNYEVVQKGNDEGNGAIYQNQEETIKYKGPGQYFMNISKKEIQVDNQDNNWRSSLQEKISPFVGDLASYKWDRVLNEGSPIEIARLQEWYKNYPLFSAMMDVTITNGKVSGVDQVYLEVMGEEAYKKPVLSAVNALRSVAESMDKTEQKKDNRVVRDIQLGFYSKDFNADEWVMAPMWRVLIDQDTFYVNALTGDVEQAR